MRMMILALGLAAVATSGLGYGPADDVVYGKFWNKGTNYTKGKTLYPKNWRAFGRDVIAGWRVLFSNN